MGNVLMEEEGRCGYKYVRSIISLPSALHEDDASRSTPATCQGYAGKRRRSMPLPSQMRFNYWLILIISYFYFLQLEMALQMTDWQKIPRAGGSISFTYSRPFPSWPL